MIKILWPTIRPDVALKRARQWREMAFLDRFDFTFGVNLGVECPAELHHGISGINSKILVTGDICGAAHSATVLSRHILKTYGSDPFHDKDIIVLASDDFQPPKFWDKHLQDQFANFDGILINDDRPGTNIIAMPICSMAYLKRLNGILYHPDFFHFFSDQELYHNCLELGDVKDLRGPEVQRFEHKHWTFPGGRDQDHFDMRNSSKWKDDKATYDRRKDLPLVEKLKLQDGW